MWRLVRVFTLVMAITTLVGCEIGFRSATSGVSGSQVSSRSDGTPSSSTTTSSTSTTTSSTSSTTTTIPTTTTSTTTSSTSSTTTTIPPTTTTSTTTTTTTMGGDPSASVDWFSDWRSGIGNNIENRFEFTDGGKWKEVIGTGFTDGEAWGQIQSSNGLGFPTENVFRSMVYESGASEYATLQNFNVDVGPLLAPYEAPEEGQYMFFRNFIRLDALDGSNIGLLHWWHFGGIHGDLWSAMGFNVEDGTVQLQIITDPNKPTFQIFRHRINTYQTYRLEVRLYRNGENTARIDVQLHDEFGAPVADSNDFLMESGGSMASQDPIITYPDGEVFFRQLQIGSNDSVTMGGMAAPGYLYIGGMAVRVSSNSEDWIGEYPVGMETN